MSLKCKTVAGCIFVKQCIPTVCFQNRCLVRRRIHDSWMPSFQYAWCASSVLVLMHVLFRSSKDTQSHVQQRAVAGNVSDAGQPHDNLREEEMGVELYPLLFTPWLIVGLFLSQRCTTQHPSTCPTPSPWRCALARLHSRAYGEQPEGHFTLNFDHKSYTAHS